MSTGSAAAHRRTILLIEDDASLAGQIADYLREHDFIVEIESRGDRAITSICRTNPALVVLDVMLPGEDGLSICRRARPDYGGPILMLTARGQDSDEVLGLELGADDYLAKPVAPRVLLARVRALLRRQPTEPIPQKECLDIAELHIDRTTRTARLSGTTLKLTSGEFELLWILASHAGQPLSRVFLFEQLHCSGWDDIDRSIDLRVSRLRQKLLAHCPTDVIKTVRGVGYLYVRS